MVAESQSQVIDLSSSAAGVEIKTHPGRRHRAGCALAKAINHGSNPPGITDITPDHLLAIGLLKSARPWLVNDFRCSQCHIIKRKKQGMDKICPECAILVAASVSASTQTCSTVSSSASAPTAIATPSPSATAPAPSTSSSLLATSALPTSLFVAKQNSESDRGEKKAAVGMLSWCHTLEKSAELISNSLRKLYNPNENQTLGHTLLVNQSITVLQASRQLTRWVADDLIQQQQKKRTAHHTPHRPSSPSPTSSSLSTTASVLSTSTITTTIPAPPGPSSSSSSVSASPLRRKRPLLTILEDKNASASSFYTVANKKHKHA